MGDGARMEGKSSPTAAESLAGKLRAFAAGLSPEERDVLGALLDRATGEADTSGYGFVTPDLFSSRAIIVVGGTPQIGSQSTGAGAGRVTFNSNSVGR